MIRVVHPGFGCWLSPIPDPGVKKAPNLGSRIRNTVIQYFRLNTDPDPDLGFWWPKIVKKITAKKKDSNLQEKLSPFIRVDIMCMCVNSFVACAGNQSPQRIRLRDLWQRRCCGQDLRNSLSWNQRWAIYNNTLLLPTMASYRRLCKFRKCPASPNKLRRHNWCRSL